MTGKKNYSHNSPVIGILYGEGIGQEIIDASLAILSAASQVTGRAFDLRMGGLIGKNALEAQGKPLTEDVIQFIRDIFDEGGSILCGPGGARFVYELRSHFGLYYKLSPINPISALDDVRLIQKTSLSNIDILMIRENVGGLYFGKSQSGVDEEGFRFSELTFGYSELEINKILSVAEHYSLQRNKKICLVLKKDAIQDITNLWLDCIEKHKKNHRDIQWQFLDIDNACYQLISNPNEFDVIVSPNMLGDILADLGATLLSSRGMSYSGNFSDANHAVFQTGHGAAYDIARKNIANPIGQIFSMIMLLETQFGWHEESSLIKSAIYQVLSKGYRTLDISHEKSHIVGTKEMGDLIAQSIKNQ